MPTFKTADRTDIHYTDDGAGPALVFTHSWGLNSGQWNQVIDHLVDKGFDVLPMTGVGTEARVLTPVSGRWTCSPTIWPGCSNTSTSTM